MCIFSIDGSVASGDALYSQSGSKKKINIYSNCEKDSNIVGERKRHCYICGTLVKCAAAAAVCTILHPLSPEAGRPQQSQKAANITTRGHIEIY